MSRRHATRDAVLTYLRVCSVPMPSWKIAAYMQRMHRTKNGAVRQMLQVLVAQGLVQRTGWGYYQYRGEREVDSARTISTPLTTTLPR